MTAKDVYDILVQFIENDFEHVRGRVDKIYSWIIRLFIGIIVALVAIMATVLLRE